MSFPARLGVSLWLALGLAGSAWGQQARLESWLTGLSAPVDIVNAGDGSGRLFIVEQSGRIRIATADGQLLGTPLLDIDSLTNGSFEQGLLGLAFIPGYDHGNANLRCFFVDYTDLNGDTVIARYQVSAGNPDVADPQGTTVFGPIDQPFGNHNGGDLAFGPDGHLYVSLGDGGDAGDPGDEGQDKDTLLGSILRLAVSCSGVAVAAPGNPFVEKTGADEIWAYGLRNPWRMSFDRFTGDLYIGDVGQGRVEEIDFQPASSTGGENYGWDCREGSTDYPQVGDPGTAHPDCADAPPVTVDPVLEYGRSDGRSVTGGYVYRNAGPLHGLYVFGDARSGGLWWGRSPSTRGVAWSRGSLLDEADPAFEAYQIVTFGEDEDAGLYLAHHGGTIFRVLGADEIFSSGFESGTVLYWSSVSP